MIEFLRTGAVLAALAAAPDAPPPAPSTPTVFAPSDAVTVPVVSIGLDGPLRQPVPLQPTDPWLGADKFQHFWMSYAVTAFVFAGTRMAGAETDAALHIAVPGAALAGIGKEVYDRRSGGRFSVRDLVADGLGVAAAFFLLREVR